MHSTGTRPKKTRNMCLQEVAVAAHFVTPRRGTFCHIPARFVTPRHILSHPARFVISVTLVTIRRAAMLARFVTHQRGTNRAASVPFYFVILL